MNDYESVPSLPLGGLAGQDTVNYLSTDFSSKHLVTASLNYFYYTENVADRSDN